MSTVRGFQLVLDGCDGVVEAVSKDDVRGGDDLVGIEIHRPEVDDGIDVLAAPP